MVRYLELLESNPNGIPRGAFERLCTYLETTNKQLIGDELRTELKTVRGELAADWWWTTNGVEDSSRWTSDWELHSRWGTAARRRTVWINQTTHSDGETGHAEDSRTEDATLQGGRPVFIW